MFNADYFITNLQLQSHIEGGFFKEIYRSEDKISNIALEFEGERNLATSVYYLLRSGEVSKFTRVKFDEVYYYNYGSPLVVHIIDSNGILKTQVLGLDLPNGERPQVIIPKNTIFGAEVLEPNSFSLISCLVVPGFSFDDMEMFTFDELKDSFPQHENLFKKLNG